MSAEEKVSELELPPAPKPAGVYKPCLIIDNLCYFSGHGPLQKDGTLITGRVGDDVDQQYGYDAARQTGLAILATLKDHLGDLGKIKRVVKLLGMVNSVADFENHPAVINGCSELFRDIFGEDCGVGTRSAVGMGSLPGNITVEIEGVVELDS
ncbi:RidA family protein [Pirellulaceae bacterium]|jgi:enamine deaminase RidA (YjgF/YER057c/UK114 family)|nr:RidA family protein [Mariniblastus sp.]MDB4755860.1 RidA family protein [Mariniblastus sp.]MDB4793956.1 RidA family protein [Pirellulaceae bacterium]